MKSKSLNILASLCFATSLIPVANATNVDIGVSIYNEQDVFMGEYVNELKTLAKQNDVSLTVGFAQSDLVQEQNFLNFNVNKCDSFIVNLVEPRGSLNVLNIVEKVDKPVVFVNRKPSESLLNSYSRAWYVGTDAAQAGRLQSEILTRYAMNHKVDRNGDGVISYLLIQGEANVPDTVLRSVSFRDSLKSSPLSFKEVASPIANWDFDAAAKAVQNAIQKYGVDEIEAIVANNDNMALGALQYLKSINWNTGDENKFIPIIGVDGTSSAVAAIDAGELVGTVQQDVKAQARVAFEIAKHSAQNMPIDEKTIGFFINKDKSVYVPYKAIELE